MSNTFKVLAARMNDFTAKLTKLNKKAAKLGCAPITYTASEMITVTWDDDFGHKMVREYHDVTVSGVAPSFEGWTFLGTIETTPAGNILRAVPGQEIPEQYRNVKPSCDHCNTNRNRKDTFIVRHDSGETKQVGRQCIRDFLGHMSPEMIAQQCTFMASLGGLGDSDEFFSATHGRPVESTVEVLGFAVALSRKYGFISKAKAEETGADSTSGLVCFNMFPPTFAGSQAMDAWRKDSKRVEISESDAALVANIREWAAKMDAEGSQFLGNLKVALANDYCESRDIGIVSAAYTAYDRAEGDPERKAQAAAAKNEHFGQIGKRDVFEMRVTEFRHRETQFGMSTIVKYQDNEGRTAVWFASGCIDPVVGETVKVKATVKNHDEYKGLKQTILSRVVTL